MFWPHISLLLCAFYQLMQIFLFYTRNSKTLQLFLLENTAEPWYKERVKGLTNIIMFAMRRVHYINVLFHIFYYYWGEEYCPLLYQGLLYRERFVKSRFHCGNAKSWLLRYRSNLISGWDIFSWVDSHRAMSQREVNLFKGRRGERKETQRNNRERAWSQAKGK